MGPKTQNCAMEKKDHLVTTPLPKPEYAKTELFLTWGCVVWSHNGPFWGGHITVLFLFVFMGLGHDQLTGNPARAAG